MTKHSASIESTGNPIHVTGRLIGIFIAPGAGAPMQSLDQAVLVEGKGLQGDRYFDDRGHWPLNLEAGGNQITLIEAESLDSIRQEFGYELHAAETRRNLVTTGTALLSLVGRRFRIADAILEGLRPCDPCRYLEQLTTKAVKQSLAGRGGLRANVIRGGCIRVGDTVEVLFSH